MKMRIGKILLTSCLLSVMFIPAIEAMAGGADQTGGYVEQLEKRVAALEAMVSALMAGKGSAVTQGTPPPVKKETATAGDGDDWGEPAVVRDTAGGRDEDARRRLVELETWKRKNDAQKAKDEEESAEKVKFDFSGKYKLRANSRHNLHLGNQSQFWTFDSSSYFDQRFQLKIDAAYGPLSSVLVLDKGNFVFDWKEGSEGTLDRWSEFQTVTSALVRELYAQYTGSFVLKAGRHSMEVGNGGVVFEGPADALTITYPLGMTPLGRVSATAAYMAVAGGWRNYDNFTYPAGDRSAVLGMANKLDGVLLRLDLASRKNFLLEPYVLKVFDRGRSGDPDLNLDRDFNNATTPRDGGFEPLWLGAAFSGKLHNFSYKGDVAYLTGSATASRDYGASALLFRGDYHPDTTGLLKKVSLGLEVGRGSGNSALEKVAASGDVEDFAGLFLCKERRKFGNIFSEDLHAGYFFADSNLANITFVRAIVEFVPFTGARGEVSLARIWTTEDVFMGRGPVGDWSRGASMTTATTRDVGWELDFNLHFPIVKRLNGFVESGVFLPGDAYLLADGRQPKAATELVIGAEFVF